MIIWEKVHQVKVKRIKQLVIKLVEGVENTHIIAERDFVLVADLEELLNFVNPVGAIDIDLSMEIKVSTDNLIFSNCFLTSFK